MFVTGYLSEWLQHEQGKGLCLSHGIVLMEAEDSVMRKINLYFQVGCVVNSTICNSFTLYERFIYKQ